MAPYNFSASDIIFELDKKIYIVDTKPTNNGLYRQNAMTSYQVVKPYLIEARSIDTDNIMFYLVWCKHHGWVQVDENTGKYVLHFKSEKSQTSFPWLSLLTPVVVLSLHVYNKYWKK